MNKVDDEWFSIEKKQQDSTLLHRVEFLEKKQQESESLIRALQESISALTKKFLEELEKEKEKEEREREREKEKEKEKEKPLTINTHDAKELLEELKVLKERELNRMLRERRPIPFVPYHSSNIASGLAHIQSLSQIMPITPLTPLTKRMGSPRISPMVGSSLLSMPRLSVTHALL